MSLERACRECAESREMGRDMLDKGRWDWAEVGRCDNEDGGRLCGVRTDSPELLEGNMA